jgi:hypothetical protein
MIFISFFSPVDKPPLSEESDKAPSLKRVISGRIVPPLGVELLKIYLLM